MSTPTPPGPWSSEPPPGGTPSCGEPHFVSEGSLSTTGSLVDARR